MIRTQGRWNKSLDCVSPTSGVSYEYVRIWKEAEVVYLKALLPCLIEVAEESSGKREQGVNWIHPAEDRGHWRACVNTAMNFRVP